MPAWTTTRKIVTSVVVGIAMIVAILFGGVYFGGWFSNTTADFRGHADEVNQVQGDGDYRIAAYDSFYNQCAGIQSTQQTIKILKKSVADNPSAVNKADLSANKITLQEQIAQYNADARKADTKANFRASDLPYQISPTDKDVSCTN